MIGWFELPREIFSNNFYRLDKIEDNLIITDSIIVFLSNKNKCS